MKDADLLRILGSRPKLSPADTIQFCLRRLGNDDTKNITDFAVSRLTYEEIIGALLHAYDMLPDSEKELER